MKFTIPVYVQTDSMPQGDRVYRLAALFHPHLTAEAATLEQATASMKKTLRNVIQGHVQERRHEELSHLAWNPELTTKRLRLSFSLARQTVNARLLFVAFRAFDRWLAFSPTYFDLWFEADSLSQLEERASAVYREHFLRLEKQEGDNFVSPQVREPRGRAWATTIELTRSTSEARANLGDSLFALLGREEQMDGDAEIHRVGRRLRDLFPGELEQAVRYDDVVEEVARLLAGADRRPVMLVGPRRVGKTAVLHEIVRRRMLDEKSRVSDRGHLWLMSPQRLISGMSYVGQWESRLLAILEAAQRRDRVLVFDNVLGLFQAGRSMQSSLSVAHVLKGAMQRRTVRVVGEMTPEAFAKLNELDRAFADLFHVVRLEEPDEITTYQILVETARQLEARWGCQFGIRATPAVYDIQRRFGRDSAFPGKGCQALARLAMKQHALGGGAESASNSIDRQQVLDEFQRETGLPMALIDDTRAGASSSTQSGAAKEPTAADGSTIRQRIGRRFVGQPEALQAAVDVFSLLESRLNDPTKPVATMLLVGPTGVGKTQFAKELARCFFGNPERLVRFDMNQFVGPRSAAQLVGTLHQPEGLLTSAIRRQPFSVVLLDEVEKAHDEVHNMLLQVLGEGRLTDAMGRTCDFSNAILLLTSNLGTTSSPVSVGFATDELDSPSRAKHADATRPSEGDPPLGETVEQSKIRRAVERFFRPEFVNRLDRTIVFHRLSRSHMNGVARALLDELFERPGLQQRRCLVDIRDEALEWIIDQGYDPSLGARAIRRAVEQQLTSRVAEFLAAAPLDGRATVVRASRLPGADSLEVEASLLEEQGGLPWDPEAVDMGAAIDALRLFMDERSRKVELLKPAGAIESGQLPPDVLRYYELHELLQDFAQKLRPLEQAVRRDGSRQGTRVVRHLKAPIKNRANYDDNASHYSSARNAEDDIADYLDYRDETASADDSAQCRELQLMFRRAAWMDVLLCAQDQELNEVLELAVSGPLFQDAQRRMCGGLFARLAEVCGATCEEQAGMTWRLQGIAVSRLLASEVGWHFVSDYGLSAFEVKSRVANEENNSDAADGGALLGWRGRAAVVRRYSQLDDLPSADELWDCLADRLPLPPELRQVAMEARAAAIAMGASPPGPSMNELSGDNERGEQGG
ncbi:MAG: ATP-dependent Clp protease ATP-binding subunit [Planctomycetales bacterium]|nr:ATP-dependent Clp protease ATP-binding subunit [Planctomycetales bacterium]